MRILVTGGAGYIGCHVVKKLIEAGHDVIVLDNFSTGKKGLLSIPETWIVEGSIGSDDVRQVLFHYQPIDAVMHFAAFSAVGESVNDPIMYYENNLAGTINLLSKVIQHSVKYFIFSSSCAVYGDYGKALTEDLPCRPLTPYGEGKLAVEKILASLATAYSFNYISLRYFNAAGADESATIGEKHDRETRLIPNLLDVAMGVKEKLFVYGTDYPTPDGTCVRDYIHVNDIANAHIMALNHLVFGGSSTIYNIGTNTGYSVNGVIRAVEEVTGMDIPVKYVNRSPGDASVAIADESKIRKELGWEPKYNDIREIIRTAWHWRISEKYQMV